MIAVNTAGETKPITYVAMADEVSRSPTTSMDERKWKMINSPMANHRATRPRAGRTAC